MEMEIRRIVDEVGNRYKWRFRLLGFLYGVLGGLVLTAFTLFLFIMALR